MFSELKVWTQAERNMIHNGLIPVHVFIPDVIQDIRYSSVDNFTGIDLYGTLETCYLQLETLHKLQKADSLLKFLHPGYRLIVYDCARPVSVQKKMWDSLDIPTAQKSRYLSNPGNHSIHNYGSAVDISIADSLGRPLDMGTDFDYFGPEAHPGMETQMLKAEKLTKKAVVNRRLLREIMVHAGFSPVPWEWWHFNACSRNQAKLRYKPIL
jgi:D-alanyl-D-alanine dipeptidase